ncbi:MAG: hypothetical protein KF784_03160 [Fimbriimonadaceae bacterium]|nr:hypothetical protein [Fimbriimonadaceae bacterium]
MRYVKELALGALTLSVLSGCGSGSTGYVPQQAKEPPKATVEAGKETNLYPMTEGNQWTYSVEQRAQNAQGQQLNGDFEITFKVVKVEETPNGKVGTVELSKDGNVTDRQKWLVNDKGMYQLSASTSTKEGVLTEVMFSPMQTSIKFPVKVGEKYKWEGTATTMLNEVGKVTAESEVLETQIVDTDQGKRFSTIPIVTSGTFAGKNSKGTYGATSWYSPNVGLVRYRQEVLAANQIAGVLTFRLKAYVVK